MPRVIGTRTVTHTEYPSMKPLKGFHGHVVKTFSSLPTDGKFFELLKRVGIVAIAPLAYLALSIIGVLGVPLMMNRYTTQEDIIDNTPYTAERRSSEIISKMKGEVTTRVNEVLNDHSVSKIKYFISGSFLSQKTSLEFDVSPSKGFLNRNSFENSVDGALNDLKNWLNGQFETQGLAGKVQLSGRAFCLAEDNIYPSSFSAGDNSTEDSTDFEAGGFSAVPGRHNLQEVMDLQVEKFNQDLPDNLKLSGAFLGDWVRDLEARRAHI